MRPHYWGLWTDIFWGETTSGGIILYFSILLHWSITQGTQNYYWQSVQCSGFINNVLPEDGPLWPKHVAHKHRMYTYFNDIFKHFNKHCNELSVDWCHLNLYWYCCIIGGRRLQMVVVVCFSCEVSWKSVFNFHCVDVTWRDVADIQLDRAQEKFIHSFNSFYSVLEHRTSTKHLQWTLFPARLLTSLQVFPAFRASSTVLHQVVLALPLLRDPWGFQSKACLSVALWTLHWVRPHFHFLFIAVATSSLASFHRFSYVKAVGQEMRRILLNLFNTDLNPLL
jgi:hypothetical protein